jgi:glucokinase
VPNSAGSQDGARPAHARASADTAISLICGVDLGGTQTRLTVVRGDGETLGTTRASTGELGGPDGLVAWVSARVRELGRGPLASVAVAAPGPLDPRRGVLVNPPNLVGWRNVELTSLLGAALDCPAHLENDANLAALGEFRRGAGRGTHTMLYVTWSTGVGGGLILDDRLFSGAHGSAGEIGHTIIDPHGPLDTCGQRGCVEVFCGGRALARQTGRSAEELFEGAAAGDPEALAVVRRAATHMGYALLNLTNLFDPEVIVMGGGISRSWAQVAPVLEEVLDGSPFIDAARRPRLCPAQLGDDAGLVGALEWARDHLAAPAPG